MKTALCLRCGGWKEQSYSKCSACRWMPVTEEEFAKSDILSLNSERQGEEWGKSIGQLRIISESIRSGRPYVFDELEVEAMVQHVRQVVSSSDSVEVFEKVMWPLPPILLVATFMAQFLF